MVVLAHRRYQVQLFLGVQLVINELRLLARELLVASLLLALLLLDLLVDHLQVRKHLRVLHLVLVLPLAIAVPALLVVASRRLRVFE